MLQIAQNLPLAQLVAYVALTCAGVTVAIVSLSFSYRQNFGWRPSAIIWSHGLKGAYTPPSFTELHGNRRDPVTGASP
jgi:hypothetical protein